MDVLTFGRKIEIMKIDRNRSIDVIRGNGCACSA